MGHCIKQIIDKLGKIYKINLKGTVNYKLPNCTKLNDIILDVSGYGYYSSPNPQKHDYRYYLNIEIKNTKFKKKKEFVAILMNPSNTFASTDKSKIFDYTIKNVIRIAYKLKYNKITVLNSYPRIDGDSNSQNMSIDENIAKINTEFIKDYVLKNKEKSTFLIAWGGNDKKVTNIQKYLEVFYNNKIEIYAYRKTSNNKPCHASILVENCYNYVSNFLNNDEKLKPLSIKCNKKNQYKFV